MKDLVIIGAGGFGSEVAVFVNEINEAEPTWNLLGFIDDNATEDIDGYPVLGDINYLLSREDKPYFAIAVANTVARESIAERCLGAGLQPATIIQPDVLICFGATIGEGSIICRDVGLSPNVKIGRFCIINSYCSFGHDAVVDDYTSIMSDALIAGDTYIGKHNYFGLRCTMINLTKTTDHCTFGASSCIVKDAIEPGTYVGVPAKLVKPLKKDESKGQMKDLVIIGAGGFGREVASWRIKWINEAKPTWNFLGFIDDNVTETPEGFPVLGNLEYLLSREDRPYFAVAIGNSVVREKIANRCREAGFPAATIVDPTCLIGENSTIGEGSIICAECDIGINVKIGEFCIFNSYCNFGHDITIGDYTDVMSEMLMGGECNIGKHNYFGLRCTVINQVDTVDHCTFGACACVVKDAAEPGTYVGVPAKMIKPLKSDM